MVRTLHPSSSPPLLAATSSDALLRHRHRVYLPLTGSSAPTSSPPLTGSSATWKRRRSTPTLSSSATWRTRTWRTCRRRPSPSITGGCHRNHLPRSLRSACTHPPVESIY
ncbi:hypothetical protein U1Q18_000995 [Sarracenia purpurea var. burkii]